MTFSKWDESKEFCFSEHKELHLMPDLTKDYYYRILLDKYENMIFWYIELKQAPKTRRLPKPDGLLQIKLNNRSHRENLTFFVIA